jgi:hypothetical protein
MAKVFRVIGQVAGVVATVAAFVPGGQGIAAIAAAVSAVSSISAQVLAKPPAAKGQITERIIGANNPLPYLMGRSYSGGVQVHDVGYGGEVNDVDNPYRFLVTVHSCAGPVEQIESTLANFSPVAFSGTAASGYYNDYWWRDTQLGARPEADALAPNFAGAPRWGASYKLSGFCAVGHTFKWSKKGKRFAGGQLPIVGEIVRGVKVYDPRLDSTYPGGSGSHRINNEATWSYSRNAALHALTYAYGRYVNGVKVFGVDLGAASIDLSSAVAWANVCDANGWNCDGTIYEPGNKWENLKRICQAGGAQPVLVGGVLRFDYQAPRTALATITRDDLASGPLRDSLGRGWKERHNTIVPRYRSANHQWEYVQSDAVSVPAFITEDGEIKRDEIQYDLVTDKNQAAELATYELYQRRELGPINLPLKPHFRSYDPGDCFTLSADLSPTGAPIKVVMRSRSVDAVNGVINCTFETENDTKHVDALGALGTEPTSFTFPTAEELDDTAAINTSAANTIYSDGLTSVEDLRPAEPGANVTAPANANRVPFSRMEGNRGYGVLFNPVPLSIATDYGNTTEGGRFFRGSATISAASQQFSIGNDKRTAVKLTAGERISVQARVARQGAATGNWQLEFWTYQADGITGSATVVASGTGTIATADGVQRAFITVPANRVFGRFELRFTSTSTSGSVQLLIAEPMVTGAASGQTVHPSFSPGPNADDAADVTATSQRSIEPEFANVEVRRFEAGNVGNRTVSHFAKRGDTAIGGGTWSLPQVLLGAGSASVNSSTGLVTLSNISQSGSYTIRYTHTDGVTTDLKMNVSFIEQEAMVRSINASPSVPTWFQSSTTSRTVTHSAIEGSSTLTGGTWSLVSTAGMTASINSSTGTVTISAATGNGSYRVRYTHTDTEQTELVVNLIYYPASDPGTPTDPDYNVP